MKKVAVILSGCGVFDGAEIHEAVISLLALARQAGFSPHFAQEVGEAMTIIGLVSAGLGVSVLPASYQRMRIDGVVYRTVLDEGADTAVWLVQRQAGSSVMAKAFADLLIGNA